MNFLLFIKTFGWRKFFTKTFANVTVFLILIYFSFPIMFMFLLSLGNFLITRSDDMLPLDYTDLRVQNISGHAFFVPKRDTLITVWYIPPIQHSKPLPEGDPFAPMRQDNQVVVLLLHGMATNMLRTNVMQRARRMAATGVHVITFDYRGYGWSSGSTDGISMVEDAIEIWEFTRRRAGKNPILLYGHSLGAAIISETALRIHEMGYYVPGIVIEAGFSTLQGVINEYFPLSLYPSWYATWATSDLLDTHGIHFRTAKSLDKLPDYTPIVLLHQTGDVKVVVEESHKLRQELRITNRHSVYHLIFKRCLNLSQTKHDLLPLLSNGRTAIMRGWVTFVYNCYDENNGKMKENCSKHSNGTIIRLDETFE